MRDLLILGTGPHAGEMVEIVDRVNRAEPTWNLLGLVAPTDAEAGGGKNGCPVLGPGAVAAHPDACLLPAFGWPEALAPPRERLASLVDPSAFVSRTAEIGAGCVLYPSCYVGLDAKLGDYVFCLSGSTINHDDVLEDRVTLCSGVRLAGAVTVEAGSYLGQACTVRELLRIGAGSLIGTGAVVVRDVPPNSVMVGNPARRLRDRT